MIRRRISRVFAPAWGPERAGTRVLLEHPDGAVRTVLQGRLAELGYDVLTCAGPEGDVGCPLLRQQPCPAVDEADVVVTGLVNGLVGRMITRRIRRRRPEVLVVAEATEHLARQHEVLADVHLVHPVCSRELLRTLQELAPA